METLKGKTAETSSSESVLTGLQRVAKESREAPGMVWTTLSHHIDFELLKRAYQLTRKDGATGIDGQTAKQYAENLEENLQDLLDRFKSGRYKAPPVRRVYIQKGTEMTGHQCIEKLTDIHFVYISSAHLHQP